MVPRNAFINKIRSLGFGYKNRQKRTDLWRRKGTTDYISLPQNAKLTEEYVRHTLIQIGEKKEQIESFISSAKS